MRWVLLLVLFPGLVFASEQCVTQFGGKCKATCASNERSQQGASLGCAEDQKCCLPGKSSAKKLKRVSGRVTTIDRAEKSITLEGITITADEAMLANIKVGDRVTVDYYSRGTHKAIVISQEVK